MEQAIDHLEAERYSSLGSTPLQWVDLAEPGAEKHARFLADMTQSVIIGIDRGGWLPAIDPAPFDALLTTAAGADAPWTTVAAQQIGTRMDALSAIVATTPVAATILARVLKITAAMPVRDAITLESLAYSTLLGGNEFKAWVARRPTMTSTEPAGPYVGIERDGDDVTITLTRSATHNAICAGMRDALFEAIAAVLDDPSKPNLLLIGEGACFSTGGSLAEFGTATDLAQAHAIRTMRSCAILLNELGDRASVLLHGACVGSGIEIPAAITHRHALANAFFQLPELKMGLIPGAGGTVTIPRAIGRHRAFAMMLGGRRIRAETARQWRLIHTVEPPR